MYAHQVIDYLNKRLPKEEDDWLIETMIDWIRKINNAQKFHLGNMYDILRPFKNNYNNPLTFKDNYMKMPYGLCWFDWFINPPRSDVSKMGILTQEISAGANGGNEGFILSGLFFYLAHLNTWDVAERGFLINLQAETKEENFGTDFENYHISPVPYSKRDEDLIVRQFLNKEGRRLPFGEEPLSMFKSAILLLNCKNIVTEDHHPSEKLNKKRRKLSRQKLFTYKTLKVVLPSRFQLPGDSAKTNIHNRIHLCRGHFKEYTVDKPLFGKHVGLYWWQPHVRGQNKDGIVVKDYEVGVKE